MDATPVPTITLHEISAAWAGRFSVNTHLTEQHAPASGDLCPSCQQGSLDYNGVLELECSHCGYTLSGGGGCT